MTKSSKQKYSHELKNEVKVSKTPERTGNIATLSQAITYAVVIVAAASLFFGLGFAVSSIFNKPKDNSTNNINQSLETKK